MSQNHVFFEVADKLTGRPLPCQGEAARLEEFAREELVEYQNRREGAGGGEDESDKESCFAAGDELVADHDEGRMQKVNAERSVADFAKKLIALLARRTKYDAYQRRRKIFTINYRKNYIK